MTGQDCLLCSQSPHDETVVARCAQFETILPLALKSKPATGMGPRFHVIGHKPTDFVAFPYRRPAQGEPIPEQAYGL